MKKEICAWALLSLLILGAWLNIRHMDRLMEDIFLDLSLSQSAVERGDFDSALNAYRAAMDTWEKEGVYTGILFSHAKLDCVHDAFFNLQEMLLQADAESAPAAFERLRYCLSDLRDMEQLSFEAVL